jgi:multisubunit Na+/H+ antiporter MnhE subunit
MRGVGRIGGFLSWWCVLFAFYLLLVASLAWQELFAGAIAAAIAAVAAVVTRRIGKLRFFTEPRWLLRLAALAWKVVVDSGIVFTALWRRLVRRGTAEGTFRTVPFDTRGRDARSAARRALVTAALSLTPNTVVVAIDRRHGKLLVHQLVPTPEPPGGGDQEWPL